MSDGDKNNRSWWHQIRELPNDSPAKTIGMTLLVALVCSILVASSAVLLKPLQVVNKEEERRKRVMEIVGNLPGAEYHLLSGGIEVEARVIDLQSGEYIRSADPRQYDQRQAARDPLKKVAIPPKLDTAGLGARASFAVVYLVKQGGRIRQIILPIRGRGYGAMIYGYIGLAEDVNTVAGLTFYEHSETPGIGALIDSPAWKKQWRGKKIWDGSTLKLGIGPGKIEPGSTMARYQVDALTGATYTGRGINKLLHYWLSEHGFGPFLNRLKR